MTEVLIAIGFTGFGFFVGFLVMGWIVRDERKEAIGRGYFAFDGRLYLVTPAKPVGEGK